MGRKAIEFGFVLTTLISALLFCSLIVMTSLSPLSEFGPNANTFGSVGMWSAIGMILVLYLLPLIIYKIRLDAIRYIIAIFCSFGILINIAVLGIVLLLGLRTDSFPNSLGIMGICIAALLVNLIWFFVTFRLSKKPSTNVKTEWRLILNITTKHESNGTFKK